MLEELLVARKMRAHADKLFHARGEERSEGYARASEVSVL